jgi:hypothetical protein
MSLERYTNSTEIINAKNKVEAFVISKEVNELAGKFACNPPPTRYLICKSPDGAIP